jgi:ABC-type branched-subunit amino acid transport system substrate-binding protein/outer membrane protein assembly factor BamD (BamD/ComL family)
MVPCSDRFAMKKILRVFVGVGLACASLMAQSQVKKAAPARGGETAGDEAGSASDRAAAAALKRAKASYQSSQFKDADDKLNRVLKQYPKAPAAEEALVILADISLRQNKPDQTLALVTRFKRAYPASSMNARMDYYLALAQLRLGKNPEAAKAFASAAAGARVESLHENAVKGLWLLIDNGGLTAEEKEPVTELLDKDPELQAAFIERIGDQNMREGRYRAARTAFETWLEKFPGDNGAGRVKTKLDQAAAVTSQEKTLLLMAPMTGEYAEIGRSLKEGATLAVEESNQRGAGRVDTRILDDQGSLIVGIHRLRKFLKEEKVDAIVGPAMSDVSAAVAVDLSARKSKIPMVTPTATTHGIAALGDGIFQINVTTGTLGQKIASYAMGCLHLKDFAIVAPESEYGYQLAEAFQKTVEKKGGTVISTQYYQPEATDLGPQFAEIRKEALKPFVEKMKADAAATPGAPPVDDKAIGKALSDSVLPIDGIFLPGTNGEEAYKLASQASFNKLRAQFLGSSGWNDKALLHRSAPANMGAYFSVDFQENPKTETWAAFQKAYTARWKHAPDKVAALAYDAGRFLLQGLTASPGEDQLIPGLKSIRTFNGVLGRIAFDDRYGANANAAIFHVEKKGFKEVESCPEAE